MEKQKICVIGGGLTGLITATVLSKLNIKVDLIAGDVNQNVKSNRTIAISQDNYDFLKELEIFKLSKKEFWPCAEMKLYADTKKEAFTEIFKFNEKQAKNKRILYMVENSKIINLLIANIKKEKLISFKNQELVSVIISLGFLKGIKKDINNSKYNLIILCTGSNSTLVKNIFNDQFLGHTYDETCVTTTLSHSSFNNIVARQIFIDDEILALLPISNTKTSIVWSVKKNMIHKYEKNKSLDLKNKIMFYTKDFLKKVKFVTNLEYKDFCLVFFSNILSSES